MNTLALVTPSSELQRNLCSSSRSILGVCRDISPSFPHFLLPGNTFYPFLSIFSARCHPLGCRAQLCPENCELETAGTGYGQYGALQPLLTEATLHTPLPVPGHPHPVLTYIILETHILYIYTHIYKTNKRKDMGNKKILGE